MAHPRHLIINPKLKIKCSVLLQLIDQMKQKKQEIEVWGSYLVLKAHPYQLSDRLNGVNCRATSVALKELQLKADNLFRLSKVCVRQILQFRRGALFLKIASIESSDRSDFNCKDTKPTTGKC